MQFRQFREELSSLAGFHTGTHLVVDEVHLNDLSVRAHELIHGRIFDETLDGSLHRIVLALLRENIDDGIARQLNEVNDFLFEDLLIPHERTATFLGIKSLLTPKERDAARATLDAIYVGYFDFFERLLPWTDSTFVTFLLAFSFARFAFNSGRIGEIHDITLLNVARLREIEGPHSRLEAAANAFLQDSELSSKSGVKQVFEECMREAHIEQFDVFDDSQWIARALDGRTDTQKLEGMVCGRFERILAAKTGRTLDLRVPIPSWMQPILGRFVVRNFDVEFPFLHGHLQYTEAIAMHYAMEADRELIGRSTYVKFSEADPKFALRFMAERIEAEDDLCVVFVQMEGQPRRFKLYASVLHNERYSYVPGCGLIVDIEAVFGVALYLGEIVERRQITSPLFYVVYSPGTDLSGETVLIPILEGSVKVFPGHLASAPPPGQHLVLRPIIYARQYWSRILSTTVGEHCRYTVKMVNSESGETLDYRVQALIPKDHALVPSFAIMTAMPEHPYLALARHAAAAGRLTLETGSEVPRGLSECLIAVWETLPLV
jgi:hypothetical protein